MTYNNLFLTSKWHQPKYDSMATANRTKTQPR